MGGFWIKTAIVAALVLTAIVIVGRWLSSGTEYAADFERTRTLAREQDARLEAELETAAQPAPAPSPDAHISTGSAADERARVDRRAAAEMTETERIDAERIYQMAETHYKMGRLPGTTFKKMIDYCRELFDRYPQSNEAAKARVLMRRLPDRVKEQYNVTQEEMGL